MVIKGKIMKMVRKGETRERETKRNVRVKKIGWEGRKEERVIK